MKVFIGADHRGFELKEKLKVSLGELGYEVADMGNNTIDSNDDYTDFGEAVGRGVVSEGAMGVVICGTGVGISIATNKVKGARCALCWRAEVARQSREHIDANVIALPADYLGFSEAFVIVKTFLETKFNGEERHSRRIGKLAVGGCCGKCSSCEDC